MKLVSIIVPIYNTELFLEDCLSSIANQSYKNIEVILMDDGSTDGSSQICHGFQLRDSRFKYFYQSNLGLSEAKNNGLGYAIGDYFGFVDSDDVIAEDFVLGLYMACESSGYLMSLCARFIFKDKIIESSLFENSGIKAFKSEELVTGILDWSKNDGCTWDKLYSSKLRGLLKFRAGCISEDLPVTFRILAKIDFVAVVPMALYGYRLREGSIANGAYSLKHLTVFDSLLEIKEIINQSFPRNSKLFYFYFLAYSVDLIRRSSYNPQVFGQFKKRFFENFGLCEILGGGGFRLLLKLLYYICLPRSIRSWLRPKTYDNHFKKMK